MPTKSYMTNKSTKKLKCYGCGAVVEVPQQTETVFCWKCVHEGQAYNKWKYDKRNGLLKKEKTKMENEIKPEVPVEKIHGPASSIVESEFTPKELIAKNKKDVELSGLLMDKIKIHKKELEETNSKQAKREIRAKIKATQEEKKKIVDEIKARKELVKTMKAKEKA